MSVNNTMRVVRHKKKSLLLTGGTIISKENYFFVAFAALSTTAPTLAFVVSVTALTVESTLVVVESILVFALSITDEAAESVLTEVSPLPPQEVRAAAITITVSNFFIEVVLVGGKTMCFPP